MELRQSSRYCVIISSKKAFFMGEHIKKDSESFQNTTNNIDFNLDWVEKPFSHPERTIRLATAFSGVIEHAFQRLELSTKIPMDEKRIKYLEFHRKNVFTDSASFSYFCSIITGI